MKLLLSLLFFVYAFALAARAESEPKSVDVLVVLATDVSGSVSEYEYALQKKGIVTALRDPEVAYVLEKCNGQGAAITYLEWSGVENDPMIKQIVGWRTLRTGDDLRALAGMIEGIPFRSSDQNTDLAGAISASVKILETAPYEAPRRIISLSGDGEQNIPLRDTAGAEALARLTSEREKALAKEYVIDALVIANDINGTISSKMPLEDYFQHYVGGGLGHQVTAVGDFEDFAKGLKRNLLREIDNCKM